MPVGEELLRTYIVPDHAAPIPTAIRKAFNDAQETNNQFALIKKLRASYIKFNDEDSFFEAFVFYLQLALVDKNSNVYVDRYIDFASRFAVSFFEDVMKEKDKLVMQNNDNLDLINGNQNALFYDIPVFLGRVFNWLLDHHNAFSSNARLRICFIVGRLLEGMGEDASIDNDLFEKIINNMLERLKDKKIDIRAQAVSTLYRLQDPRNNECRIIKAFLFHLGCDPNYLVRLAVVNKIAATRSTLPYVLRRTRDLDENVRKAAYSFIASKIHIRSLTICQREEVLKRGLGDRSSRVRRFVEKKLVPVWLNMCNGAVVEFLYALDVGNSESCESCADVLRVIFQSKHHSDLVRAFGFLGDNKLVPFEKLSPEVSAYWRYLFVYLAVQTKKDGYASSAAEALESMMPELTRFCLYVQRFLLKGKVGHLEDEVVWEFVAKQLLAMLEVVDLSEKAGRDNLYKAIKVLFMHNDVGPSLVRPLMSVFVRVESNSQNRIIQIAEIISEIREPLSKSIRSSTNSIVVGSDFSNIEEELKLKSKRVENARMSSELNANLEEAVRNRDFIKAQSIQCEIQMLDEEKQKLYESVTDATELSVQESMDDSISESFIVPNVSTDYRITNKCLALIVELMQDRNIKLLNPTLQTLLEEFIVPCLGIIACRKMAIKAICVCSFRSLPTAKKYMPIMEQMISLDVSEVRVATVSAIFDLVLNFGINAFPKTGSDETDRITDVRSFETENGDKLVSNRHNDDSSSIVDRLLKFMDDSDVDVRTKVVENLCKLLAIGAITSPKLLTRLIIMWYSPLTESDSTLRHIIGTFFPLYASLSKTNQLFIEKSFLPTLKVLFEVPSTSPLSEIDVADVGLFLVNLTRHDFLQKYENTSSEDSRIHDSIAITICTEILTSPDSFKTRIFLKILDKIQISSTNFVILRSLKVLTDKLLAVISDKSCLRIVRRIELNVNMWLKKDTNLTSQETMELSQLSSKVKDITTKSPKRRALFTESNFSLLDVDQADYNGVTNIITNGDDARAYDIIVEDVNLNTYDVKLDDENSEAMRKKFTTTLVIDNCDLNGNNTNVLTSTQIPLDPSLDGCSQKSHEAGHRVGKTIATIPEISRPESFRCNSPSFELSNVTNEKTDKATYKPFDFDSLDGETSLLQPTIQKKIDHFKISRSQKIMGQIDKEEHIATSKSQNSLSVSSPLPTEFLTTGSKPPKKMFRKRNLCNLKTYKNCSLKYALVCLRRISDCEIEKALFSKENTSHRLGSDYLSELEASPRKLRKIEKNWMRREDSSSESISIIQGNVHDSRLHNMHAVVRLSRLVIKTFSSDYKVRNVRSGQSLIEEQGKTYIANDVYNVEEDLVKFRVKKLIIPSIIMQNKKSPHYVT